VQPHDVIFYPATQAVKPTDHEEFRHRRGVVATMLALVLQSGIGATIAA
jgi:hypothetical protein